MAMFDPNAPMPDLQTQQADLDRQRLVAAALRKQAGSTQMPEGQMVGNRFVAPHWTEGLAAVLDKFNAPLAEAQLGQSQARYNQGVQQAQQGWQSSLPQSVPATPGRPELPGPVDPTTGSPELAAVAPTPAQLPSRSAVLEATLRGMRIPGNEKQAELWGKGMQEEQTREDVQAARKEDRDLQRQMSRENLAATLLQRQREAELRSEDNRLSTEQRREAAREAAEAKRQHNEVLLEIAKLKSGGADKEKGLPSAQSNAWVKNNSSMKFIDDALDAVDKYPQAFSGAKSVLPQTVQAKVDPKGVDARALVANIGSLKIHDRSGQAVSAAEMEKLKPFIPIMDGPLKDDAPTIKKKLNLFALEYSRMQQEILDFAGAQNYRSPGEIYKMKERTLAPNDKGKFTTNPIPDMPTVNSPEEAAKLAPGTQFRTPDGQIRTRN